MMQRTLAPKTEPGVNATGEFRENETEWSERVETKGTDSGINVFVGKVGSSVNSYKNAALRTSLAKSHWRRMTYLLLKLLPKFVLRNYRSSPQSVLERANLDGRSRLRDPRATTIFLIRQPKKSFLNPHPEPVVLIKLELHIFIYGRREA
jgi:hypothetical protein